MSCELYVKKDNIIEINQQNIHCSTKSKEEEIRIFYYNIPSVSVLIHY
jgi:hypothetical protein